MNRETSEKLSLAAPNTCLCILLSTLVSVLTGATLAKHFDDEVVPLVSPLGAGSYSVANPQQRRGYLGRGRQS
jgi:hypothetical protein